MEGLTAPTGIEEPDFGMEASPARENLPVAAVTDAAAAKHVFAGVPKLSGGGEELEVLVNTGYAVGYSESRRDPLWSAYHLNLAGGTHTGKRPKVKFATDNRTTARVKDGDYSSRSNEFDRGHMTPDHAILKFYGTNAAIETFTMSNVCPQNACLNEETWEAWEKVVADGYTSTLNEVWVVTGPVFGTNPDHVGPHDVAIPESFYSVVVHKDGGSPRILCVIMQQNVHGTHTLQEFVRPLSEVENLTGLDFFPGLTTQQKAQATVTDAHWALGSQLTPTFHCRISP